MKILEGPGRRVLEHIERHPNIERKHLYEWAGRYGIAIPSKLLSRLLLMRYCYQNDTRDAAGRAVRRVHITSAGTAALHPKRPQRLSKARQHDRDVSEQIQRICDLPPMDPNVPCVDQWSARMRACITTIYRPGSLDYLRYPSLVGEQRVFPKLTRNVLANL